MAAMFWSDLDEMRKIYKGLSTDALHQILINFSMQYQKEKTL